MVAGFIALYSLQHFFVPTRIIVGEVRDAAAADMLTAMLTGHEGSLSTGHANSVSDMLIRLETMVLSAEDLPLRAIRRKVASALDIVVHLGRLRDKSRRVLEITEVVGYEGEEIMLNPLFQFEDAGELGGPVQGRLVQMNRLIRVDKLQMAGCMGEYAAFCASFPGEEAVRKGATECVV